MKQENFEEATSIQQDLAELQQVRYIVENEAENVRDFETRCGHKAVLTELTHERLRKIKRDTLMNQIKAIKGVERELTKRFEKLFMNQMTTEEQEYHDRKKLKSEMTSGGLVTACVVLASFWFTVLYMGCN